jgi:hypothetical protein
VLDVNGARETMGEAGGLVCTECGGRGAAMLRWLPSTDTIGTSDGIRTIERGGSDGGTAEACYCGHCLLRAVSSRLSPYDSYR